MSDAKTPENPANPTPPPNEPGKKRTKKKRNWRKRVIIALSIFIGLMIILRVLVGMLLPTVLNKVAKGYQLTCTYGRLDLSMTAGTAEIWNLMVQPQEGGEPIFQADYCQGEISIYNLLKGRLVVYRMVADGVDLDVQRTANGKIPLLARFASNGNSTAKPASSNSTTGALDLQPPLRVDALRLEHIRARFHDQCVKPELDARLALDLRLSNLGTPNAPTRFEMDFSSDPILDSLQIDGECTGDSQTIDGQLHIAMRGLHLKPAQGYLEQAGLRPTAENISAAMTGDLKASIAQNPADGISAVLKLDQAHITVDGQEFAAMDHLQLNADSLNTALANLSKLQISGVRCRAARGADGALALLGLEIVPPSAPASAAPSANPSAPAPTVAPVAAAQTAFRFKLAQFLLQDMHAAFQDDSVSPPVSLGLDVKELSALNIDSSLNQANPAVKLTATLSAPGMIRQMTASGELHPSNTKSDFNLTAKAEGIAPAAIKPYLDAAGLESQWKDGTLTFAADGSFSSAADGTIGADFHMHDAVLADGDQLLGMGGVSLTGLSLNPQTGGIHADAIELTGPELSISKDANGELHALGFVTKTPSAPPPTVAAPPVSSAPAAAPGNADLNLPKIDIGHFLWKGMHISFSDQTVAPPAAIELSDAGVELNDFSIDLNAPKLSDKPGRIHAWLSSPGLAKQLSLAGSITTGQHRAELAMDVTGQGIQGNALKAYLTPLGIEPTLKDGNLSLHATVSAAEQNGWSISLGCEGVKYSDGTQPLASLDALKVDDFQIGSSGISIGLIQIDAPRATVMRDADGTLELAGVRLIGKPSVPQATPLPPIPAPAATAPAAPAPIFTAQVKQLALNNAAIEWIDRAVNGGVDTTAHLSLNVANLSYGDASNSATLHVAAAVDGSLQSLTADGTLVAGADRQALQLAMEADGIRAGAAAAYLPPNLLVKLADGRLRTSLSAQLAANPAGGQSIEFLASDLDYRDGADGPRMLKFDSFHAKADRLDAAAKVIALDDITLKGLETSATKTENGIDLLGIELAKNAPPTPAAPVVASSTPSTAPSAPVASAPPVDAMAQLAAQRNKYPWITLNTLDLNLARFTFINQTVQGSVPLVVSNLRLHNPNHIAWLGKDPESNPPTDLELTGRIDPVAENLDVKIHATPFSKQKILGLDVTVSGIHGQGLTDLEPNLRDQIDATGLTNGEFHVAVDSSLQLRTVGPADFDLSRGGKLDLSVKDLSFKADPTGPVLAGVGEIQSEGIAISPDASGIDVKELEIDNIVGRASRDNDGIHACGLLLKNPAPTTQPASTAPVKPSATPPPPLASSPPVVAANLPPEYKIDRLAVSGMDFVFEDHICNPPLIVPISGLDAEAQDLSSLAMVADKPVRFSVLVNSAKTPLPGTAKDGKTTDRELFSQITSSGVVSLYPHLKGWTKASVSGFEMVSLHAMAEQYKATLGGGTFDGDVDVRFIEDGGIDTSTKLVMTDLSLSEPPDGIIRRTLKLPAPLDFVIGVLQDQDGSITLSLNVPMKSGNLDVGAVTASASLALLQIVGTAIASAPLKVTSLFGLGGGGNKPETPVVISFMPGYADVDPGQTQELVELARRLREHDSLDVTLRHDMGALDIALAANRVNPSPDDALALAGQFQRQKQELLPARTQAAGELRALLGSGGQGDIDAAVLRLRNIDQRLSDTENAIDRAYDLLRPGADRQAQRRTRAAALAVARARLDTIRNLLLTSALPTKGKVRDISGQIHIANPQFVAAGDTEGHVTITIVKKK